MSKRPLSPASAWVAVIALALAICFTVFAAASKDEPESGPDAKAGDARKQDKDEQKKKRPTPHKDLAPGQVVRIVMDALKNNDEKDSGIAVTFEFASPENKKVTGPLKRFIPMVKSPAYAPLLRHKSATYGKVLVKDDVAETLVTITDARDREVIYAFRLSKQPDGEQKGCWMTDGVVRVDPKDLPDDTQLDDPAKQEKPDRA